MSIAMEALFWDNVKYNANMSHKKAKPKHREIIRIMRPDIVLKKLEELGVEISERTLQRYVKDNLIPEPERKSGGRGKGRITDYPEETPTEAYASYYLMHGDIKLPPKMVAEARNHALHFEENPYVYRDEASGYVTWFIPLFFSDWLLNKGKAEKGILDRDVEIAFIMSGDKDNPSWEKEVTPADKGLITIETRCVTNGETKRNSEYKIPRTKDIDFRQVKPLMNEI